MSDRFAYLVVDSKRFSFPRLADDMARYDVSLTNPATGLITALSLEGDEQPVLRPDLETAIVRGQKTTFQLWIGEGDDLVCEIRPRGPLVTEWYSFANPGHETSRLVRLFLRRFDTVDESGGLVLGVLDIEGSTAEFEWDAFPRQPESIPTGPSLIALTEENAKAVVAPSGYRRMRRGGLVLWVAEKYVQYAINH